MNLDRTIGELTVRELLDIMAKATPSAPRQAYGLRGIAELFGVSLSQAKRIKASGVIDAAISQSGRTIVVDSSLALSLYARATHGRKS